MSGDDVHWNTEHGCTWLWWFSSAENLYPTDLYNSNIKCAQQMDEWVMQKFFTSKSQSSSYHFFTENVSKLITRFVFVFCFYHLTCSVFSLRTENFHLFPVVSDSEVFVCHNKLNRITALNEQRKSLRLISLPEIFFFFFSTKPVNCLTHFWS